MLSELEKIHENLNKPKYAAIRDRMMAIALRRQGKSLSKIATKLNRSDSWVSKWNILFRQKGFSGLFDASRPGAPSKLTKVQEKEFIERLTQDKDNKEFHILYSGTDFQQLLKKEFNTDYSLSGVYNLLSRLWIKKIKPRTVHYKNDPEKMKKWLEETLPFFYKKYEKTIQQKK